VFAAHRIAKLSAGLVGLMLVALGPVHAQPSGPSTQPTCRTSLDSIDAKVRQNYAGFLLEVHGERRDAYDTMLRRVAGAANTTALGGCFPVLASYTSWYNDPHLFVFQRQSTDSLDAAQRAARLRRLPLTEASVRASLEPESATRDPIEGIWYEGPLRMAVVPDPDGSKGEFVAVVLQGDTSTWTAGRCGRTSVVR
jgi:hypothetical protein